MLSDVPNASWHPALMPNSTADLTPQATTSSPAQHRVEEDRVLPATNTEQTQDDQHERLGSESWLPDAGANGNWMEGGAENAPAAVPEEPESSTVARHSARMSFARTVSHEVNWNDDDDVDWDLPQTGTDPSKFLPDTGRTNSFPPAPPLQQEPSHELEQPLPANQTEELLREIEQEENEESMAFPDGTSGSISANASGYPDGQVTGDNSDSHRYADGGFNGTRDDAQQARYEEGVPLMSSTDNAAAQVSSGDGGHDLFGDATAGEDDDFFGNVRGNPANEEDNFQPPPFERKSTMDVLNGLNMGPAGSGFVPLEGTAEETETEGGVDQPHGIQHLQTETTQPTETAENAQSAADGENLDEKWKAMFADADDEDFLPDEESEPKEVDPTAFLGSDDEGLLDESEVEQTDATDPLVTSGSQTVPSIPAVNQQYFPATTPSVPTPSTNPYLPAASPMTAATANLNPYLPASGPIAPVQPPVPSPFTASSAAPLAPAQPVYGRPPLPQEKNKAQSFADKSKGGYTSPYDLPMEVVKPKKRASTQPLRNTSAPIPSSSAMPPPPRSASSQSHPPPPSSGPHPPPPNSAPIPGMPRPGPSHSTQAATAVRKPAHESFFEELPVTTKARPASRSSHKSQPSPTQTSAYAPPPHSAPFIPPAGPPTRSEPEPDIPNLVAPPRVNPYASLTNPTVPSAVPPTTSTRYSPAPASVPHANAPVPAPASNRYSPAPSVSRQPSSSYGPAAAVPGPPLLPHMPRTSSPLAHFEISHEKSRAPAPAHTAEGSLPERRSSSSLYDSRLHKVPALPPTREVEEEEVPSQTQSSPGQAQSFQPTSPPDSRYAPLPQKARQTPPPRPLPPSTQTLLSPPKRTMSSHSPLASSYEFAPPPRSQTQSPGTLYGNRTAKPADPVPRPSSANAPTSPRTSGHATAAIPPAPAPFAPTTGSSRSRGFSLNLNVIPPTDGRELDPLQRWRGAPLVSWGVGGTFITMFPKEVPRYGMNESTPSVVRSPGEVKVQNIKDITPLEERLAKFPGPLKGKSKKKETIAWLTTGIESLERGLPKSLFIHPQLSHDDKRAVERVLLWKILRLFVESDGVLEGNPTVEKAVRDILTPGLETSENTSPYSNGVTGLGLSNSLASAAPDAVNSSTVEQIRRHLLAGECEKAIWAAVDQRLWGHALLLANALAPALYKQVTQEFVKKEVNLPGYSNEPLATLYEVLSGNHEESVDELVPVHARAGLQLIAKDPVSGPSKDGLEGLDKWRETLSLILSNRSADDARAISSLGVLLSGYGRAEAAHICFMFARSHSVFGGLDDPASNFVLVGSDHQRQAEQFAKEIEPLLLSEVYEYGQSLAGGSNVPVTNPHLAAYKLQHAFALAEYGFRDKALQYCDAIAAAITSQTKRSPYHHPILENAVEDLMKRLKQAPKEESNSWIPKPNMNKVSDSVWSRFNKFVAGDDNDSSGQGSPADGETGPFARVAGGTPTISRSPSVNNLETFGAAVPSYGMPSHLPNLPAATSAPPTRAASRYAPAAPQPAGTSSKSYSSTSAYAPRSSMERTSSEMNRSSFELPRRSLELKSGNSGVYSPVRSGSPAAMYTPYSAEFSSPQGLPYHPLSQSTPPQTSARQHSVSYPDASTNGVPADSSLPTPPSSSQASRAQDQAPGTLGYQPTSYGYEPPSFNPHEAPVEDKNENSNEGIDGNSYEPPSYQPYSYEPPSYEPEPQADNGNDSGEESKPKPKKKGIMYDDEDDFPAPKPAEKTKEEKDRENAELFRKAAEEDAKRAAEAAKQTKKGWGFTSWFGVGAKKDTSQESSPNKPIRAKLGEANSFYYDPELKRWVNKNASPEDNAKIATPPPPKAAPRSSSSSPAPPRSPALSPSGDNETGRASAPPAGPPRSTSATLSPPPSGGLASSSLDSGLAAGGGAPPPGSAGMLRSVSNTSSASAPPLSAPNRPPTSLSNSSSIDDLLGAAGPRRPGAAKKPRKSARYVDVMTK